MAAQRVTAGPRRPASSTRLYARVAASSQLGAAGRRGPHRWCLSPGIHSARGTIAATGICDPTWVYLATLIVALIAVAAEIVLGSSDDSGRPCPSCNTQVPTGRTRCEAYGYDFAAGARPDP
jgi:hypothetical protein